MRLKGLILCVPVCFLLFIVATWNTMNSASVPTIFIALAYGSTECHQSTASQQSTTSSTASPSTALPTQLVQQFKPLKSFKFPKRSFSKKGEE